MQVGQAGLIVLSCIEMYPSILFAGMPSFSLSDVAQMRLEVISFFLLLFVLSGFALRWVWNGLARDFPRLPKLTYFRAMGLMMVWGALFVLVLTMISGARELMTPGAWKKDGVTYKLADDATPMKTEFSQRSDLTSDSERKKKLNDLRFELWNFAAKNNGRFPKDRESGKILPELWQCGHPSLTRFILVPAQQLNAGKATLLVVEPDVFEGMRFGLFTDGVIRIVTDAEITTAFAEKGGS